MINFFFVSKGNPPGSPRLNGTIEYVGIVGNLKQ